MSRGRSRPAKTRVEPASAAAKPSGSSRLRVDEIYATRRGISKWIERYDKTVGRLRDLAVVIWTMLQICHFIGVI
jgi:hypothetical protein